MCDFGLTPNQAKVYLAIVQLGIASVGKVSKASKVRREDVYRILPKLERMGLTEKILGKPTKVRAIPVDDAFGILIKREQETTDEKMSSLMAKKDEFLKHFRNNRKRSRIEEEEEPQFALISEREAIVNKGVVMMKKAEKEINMITSTNEFFHLQPAFGEPIEKALKRGIKVRIILQMLEPEESVLKNIEDYRSTRTLIELKYAYQSLSHYLVVDYKQVLMATSPDFPLGKHPYLWTNNKSFVGLMQENFEEAWHTCVNSNDVQINDVSEKLTHIIEQLTLRDHVVFVYETVEAKHNVLFNYLKAGLDNDEVGVYVATEESPSQIRDAMKRFGIDAERLEKKGALHIFGYNDFYILNGRFDMAATFDLWNKLYDESLAKGFKGLRVTGEASCFIKHDLIDQLLKYERSLQRVLDIPMIAICAYNAKVLADAQNPINLYTELVKTHGTVLFAGIDNKLGKVEIRKA